MSRVVVVGAGLAGLACAHALLRRGIDALLLEASPEAGGVVGTLEVEGFRFEAGPHALLPTARTFRRLCGELGIADRLLASSPRARRRFLWHRDRLVAAPLSPLQILATPLLSARGKLRLLSEPFRPPSTDLAGGEREPSLAALLTERIGPEATRRLAAPFVRGVWAGDIERLGARSAFPKLVRALEDRGSLVRGLLAARRAGREPLPGPSIPNGRLVSFPGGLGELPLALARALGERLRTRTPVRSIRKRETGGFLVATEPGDVEADELVLAVPAPAAARLLESLPGASAWVRTLRAIEHPRIRVVHLGFASDPGIPDGFGFLVPPETDTTSGSPRALGMIFASRLFPDRTPGGAASVSAIYRAGEGFADDDPGAVRIAREDLARALRREAVPEPAVARVLHRDDVIPQYEVGHHARVAALESEAGAALPGLRFAGSWIGGVSVEDVLTRGIEVADRVGEALRRTGGGEKT